MIDNVRRLASAARARGVVIIHVWFVVEPGAPGVTLNAPLFEGLVDSKAMVRGSWGAAPVPGLEPQPGDFIVEKMRMSAWEGTRLETILKATGRDMIVNTGAWTNMSVEHTARTGADKGYFMIVPEDCCSTMNADWHNASINFALQNVSVVTNTDAVVRVARLTGPAMPKLFHLNCSPRADSAIAAPAPPVFVDRFSKARPDWDIDVMNLWREQLPEFEGYVLEAKYARMNGHSFTDSQRDAFAVAERIAASPGARRSRADLDADVELQHPLPAEAMVRRDRAARTDIPLRSAIGYQPLLDDRPTLRDRRERRRLRHRHESRPHRHGDALPARGPALHRHRQCALRADRTDDGPGGTDPRRARHRASAPRRAGGAVLRTPVLPRICIEQRCMPAFAEMH